MIGEVVSVRFLFKNGKELIINEMNSIYLIDTIYSRIESPRSSTFIEIDQYGQHALIRIEDIVSVSIITNI